MKFVLIVLSLLTLDTANAAVTASVVTCTGSIKGTYALDYLHLMKEQGKAPDVQKLDLFVSSGLLQYLGFFGLSQSARNMFAAANSQPNDFSNFNVWQEAAFGFDPVPLGEFAEFVPAGCKPLNNSLKPVLVLNNNANNRIVAFDPKIVAELKAINPVQFQFLVNRLWLMEFTDDEELIYSINRLWHSEAPFKDEKLFAEMQNLFQRLAVSPKRSDSICERSQFVLEAFKRTLHKNCNQITDEDLASIQDLQILDKDRTVIVFDKFELRKIDLNKLASLRSFSASNVHWFGVSLIEGFFANVPTLQHLDLSKNQITVFRKGLLPAHKSLLSLNLETSFASDIYPGFFEDVFSDDPSAETSLKIGNTFLNKWDPSVTAGLENLKRLDLWGFRTESHTTISELSNMNRLTELNLTSVQLTLKLKSSDFPDLKKLTISRIQNNPRIEMEGSWPQLEHLDVGYYGGVALPPNATFKSFPNVRFLDLSANNFWATALAGDDVKKSGFAELSKLEHVRFLDTSFWSSKGEELLGPLLEELPPSVRLVEVCTQRTSDNMIFARSYLRKLMQERPYLKVRTKINCRTDEEWVDVNL